MQPIKILLLFALAAAISACNPVRTAATAALPVAAKQLEPLSVGVRVASLNAEASPTHISLRHEGSAQLLVYAEWHGIELDSFCVGTGCEEGSPVPKASGSYEFDIRWGEDGKWIQFVEVDGTGYESEVIAPWKSERIPIPPQTERPR